MSKLNIGVGEDFPVQDDDAGERFESYCGYARHYRYGHRFGHRHGPEHMAKAFIALPAAAATVTVAVLYPLTTLGVIVGLGALAAAHRHSHRREEFREEFRRYRREERDRDRGAGPQPDAPQPLAPEAE